MKTIDISDEIKDEIGIAIGQTITTRSTHGLVLCENKDKNIILASLKWLGGTKVRLQCPADSKRIAEVVINPG